MTLISYVPLVPSVPLVHRSLIFPVPCVPLICYVPLVPCVPLVHRSLIFLYTLRAPDLLRASSSLRAPGVPPLSTFRYLLPGCMHEYLNSFISDPSPAPPSQPHGLNYHTHRVPGNEGRGSERQTYRQTERETVGRTVERTEGGRTRTDGLTDRQTDIQRDR